MMPNYFFNAPLGPTEVNLSQAFSRLGWQQQSEKSVFNNDNLLSDSLLNVFEHKHRLTEWLKKNNLDFSPKTVILDELTLHKTLASLAESCHEGPWILKPALLNNGQGIQIFPTLAHVAAYYQQNNRYSGLHVLQAYVCQPMLWQQRKFSIRMFVMLSFGDMYLYPEGYLNVCNTPYCLDDLTQLNAHLTNEHLNTYGANNNEQILSTQWPMFQAFFPLIKHQCEAIFLPFCKNDILTDKTFAILGVDFMIDDKQRLWLLEVNHGACFPVSNAHSLYEALYTPFWNTVAEKVALCVATCK